MPDARCPTCPQRAPCQDWQAVPAESFPFVIRCPSCGAEADVAAIGWPAAHDSGSSAGGVTVMR